MSAYSLFIPVFHRGGSLYQVRPSSSATRFRVYLSLASGLLAPNLALRPDQQSAPLNAPPKGPNFLALPSSEQCMSAYSLSVPVFDRCGSLCQRDLTTTHRDGLRSAVPVAGGGSRALATGNSRLTNVDNHRCPTRRGSSSR
jgi:hypothetical protein